jgi:hypothetical protein
MKKYKSKIGLELTIPLAIIFGSMLCAGILSKNLNMILIALVITAFICHMFSTTEYIIDKESLRIKCGFFINTVVDINSIRKISESYNILSSPAASLDRLEIIHDKESVLISPKDKKDFIDALKAINPNIEVEYRKKTKDTT